MVLAHDSSKRTQDVQISEDVTFTTMLLSTKTEQGLRDAGFLKPSPIQLHGIPLGKCGFDLLLEAKSGTGKTAVFTVIALEKIDLSKSLQVVILAPTREIVAQICDVIKQIGLQFEGLRVEVVMGGLPVEEDIAKFRNKRKVQIVVGSPGRLRYLIQDGYIDTSAVRLLVLDEADKLMEKSFQVDINYIFSCLPAQKQVVMSSATYPESTKAFINQYVKNSQLVCPDTTNILIGIEQKVTQVMCNSNVVRQTKLRYEELIKILSAKQFKQCLIFCNYQARVAELHKLLTKDKWPSEQLYGRQEQLDRLEALKTLQEYKCRILVTTDLAARGIDASNVDLVINFEPPYDWQTYLHRIGRAGRFGAYGIAVTILSIGKEEINFKKSLSFMKDSLNICDMWTNKKYNIASSDTDPAIENDPKSKQSTYEQNGNNKPLSIESDNSTETVTCVGNTFNSEDINEIEKEISTIKFDDFQNFEIQNSYHEQVQTFADLLKSYENDTGIENGDTYNNTLDCENVETEDCLTLNLIDESLELNDKLSQNLIRELETEEPDVKVKQVPLLADLINQYKEPQEDSIHNSIKDNNYQFPKINQNSGNGNQIEPSVSDYGSKEIEKDTIYVNKCSFNKNSNTRHSKTKEDVNELINPYNEMTLMGLPTEFRSARNVKNRNKNLKHSILKHQEQNYHSYLEQESDNINDENHNIQGNESYKQYKERKTYKNKVAIQQHEPFIQKPKVKVDPERSADEKYSHANYYQMSKSKYRTTDTNYINWYNQLKMRTKQIEMALYIEELSKM